MRALRWICLLVLFASLLTLPVRAEEIRDELYARSGAQALLEALPEEARFLLSDAGISPSGSEQNAASRLFAGLAQAVRESWTEPLRALLLLIAVILLCRIIQELAPDELAYTVNLCGTLSAAAVLLTPLAELIGQTASVVQAIGVFLLAAVPIYAGLLVSAGNAIAGSTYGALTLAAANLVSAAAEKFLVPLLRVFVALSTVSAATSFDLKKLTDALYRGLKWVLILTVTVYTGILSLQTLVSAGSDAAAGKAAKMIASSAIPIVGGAFGDAFSAISASVSLVKSGVGAFGLLASLAIFLPLCLQAAVWLAVCLLASLTAELFGLSRLTGFLDGCMTALRLLLAVVFSVGAVSVVSAAVVLCVRGAYA